MCVCECVHASMWVCADAHTYVVTDVHVCMYIFPSDKINKTVQCAIGCDITHIMYHLQSHRLDRL
jgi:hypothetical protein